MQIDRKKNIFIGIDCSCDDTSIGVVEFTSLDDWRIISDVRIGQEDISQFYGGVVPEVSSRLHLRNIESAFDMALKNININQVTAIAATFAPGLLSSLVVEYSFALTMAQLAKKPFIPVHHIEAHLLIAARGQEWPFIAVIVSGGHSMLVLCKSFGDYEVLCESGDDAAGECYDKLARRIGFGFPGGSYIENCAKLHTKKISLTLPCYKQLRLSFSGLKTQCLKLLETESKENVCYALQNTITESIKEKMRLCFEKTGIDRFVVCGGVAANSFMRESIKSLNYNVVFPDISLCTDNGVMVAVAGFYHLYFDTGMTKILPNNCSRLSLVDFTNLYKNNNS